MDPASKLCCVILPEGIIDILIVGDMVYEAFTLELFASSFISMA